MKGLLNSQVRLTEAGAARWPEFDIEAGTPGYRVDWPDQWGNQRVQITGWPCDLLLAAGDYTSRAPDGVHTTHQRGTGAVTCTSPTAQFGTSDHAGNAPANPPTPAALEAPRPLAPPVHTPQEVTACPAPAPTGTDLPAPLTPDAVTGWPGLTDDEISAFRWVTF